MSPGVAPRTGYRFLLRVLPREFRECRGREMERAFLELLDESDGVLVRARTWAGALVDMGRSAWSLRTGRRATVEFDGRSITVLGVMPETFAFPDPDTGAWIPAGIDPADPPGRSSHYGTDRKSNRGGMLKRTDVVRRFGTARARSGVVRVGIRRVGRAPVRADAH